MAYWVIEIAVGWSRHDLSRTTLAIVGVLLVAFTFWTRQGFCDLLARYDAELRSRQGDVR